MNKSKEITQLENYCIKHNIRISEDELSNIIFIGENFTFRIHPDIFYRHSGLYSIKKEIKEGFSDFYPVTNEMFYMGFIKSSINKAFDIENE